MNLGVAGNAPLFAPDQKHRTGKVRPRFEIPASGIFNRHRLAARSFQLFRAQAVVEPEGLQVAFRIREITAGGFADFAAGYEPAIGCCSGKELFNFLWYLINHTNCLTDQLSVENGNVSSRQTALPLPLPGVGKVELGLKEFFEFCGGGGFVKTFGLNGDLRTLFESEHQQFQCRAEMAGSGGRDDRDGSFVSGSGLSEQRSRPAVNSRFVFDNCLYLNHNVLNHAHSGGFFNPYLKNTYLFAAGDRSPCCSGSRFR